MGANDDTRRPPPERVSIAKLAVQRSRPLAREERVDEPTARLLANLEGNLLAKIEDLREEVGEHAPRVPVEMAPVPAVDRRHWLHSVGGTLAGIGAVLAGLTALMGAGAALWSQIKPAPPVDYSADIRSLKRFRLLATQQAQLQAKYDAAFRAQVRSYFEAQGLKVPPALGELPGEPAELLPTPLVDPHRISKTPRVQPRDPLPLPPALPGEFDAEP